MAAFILPLVVSLITLNSALSARIAGFSGSQSGSHYFVIKKAMEELMSRGHEVSKNISYIFLIDTSLLQRHAITQGA